MKLQGDIFCEWGSKGILFVWPQNLLHFQCSLSWRAPQFWLYPFNVSPSDTSQCYSRAPRWQSHPGGPFHSAQPHPLPSGLQNMGFSTGNCWELFSCSQRCSSHHQQWSATCNFALLASCIFVVKEPTSCQNRAVHSINVILIVFHSRT